MKRALAIFLAATIIATFAAPAIPAEEITESTVQTQETSVPQDLVWNLSGADDLQEIQGNIASYQGITIDATDGKFFPRGTDTQINAQTRLTIPVQANPAGATLVLTLSGGSSSVTVNETEYLSSNSTVNIPLQASDSDFGCEVVFTSQSYLSQITLTYNEPEAPYPGTPGEVQLLDTDYTFESADALADENGSAVTNNKLEGNRGRFADILVDARSGKFNVQPEQTRVAINAGTVLYLPVAYDAAGATLMVAGTQDGSTPSEIVVDGVPATTNTSIELEMSGDAQAPRYVCIEFKTIAYVTLINLNYASDSDYPTPDAQAEDTTWDLTGAGETQRPNVQGGKGEYAGIQIDATAGKFTPRDTDTQINPGTVLYLPVAYDAAGATLIAAGTQDGSTPSEIVVDGETYTTNAPIELKMTDEAAYPKYICIEFNTTCYATLISLNYASDSDYATPDVQAKDTAWNLTAASETSRPNLQGGKGEYAGIQIDATTGKFSPREEDTQITAGTVLYIPVAPDEKGASITLAGNNYNNLTLTLNGSISVEVGKETPLPQVTENTYLTLSFDSADGTGSCYLSAITIDYMSDDTTVAHTVTVGAGGQYDYTSIQAALDANDSSIAEPLVLLIAPGTYREKITVSKPGVSFQPLYQDGGEIRIEAGYYSSNTFDEDGTFIPQDEYDVGTDQSGTVLVTETATGFSAVGITFVNTYNLTDHTQPGEQTPAVAFSSAADKVYLSGCRFLGRQDTLYLHGSGARVMVENSYIEGTVDFIFGDANAIFVDCELFMAYYPGKNNGYFTAPNTKKGNTGLVFYSCELSADAQYSNGGTVSLGRPWQTEIYTETARTPDGSSYLVAYDPDRKNPSYETTSSAATFVDCIMPDALTEGRWSIWTRKDKDGDTVDVTYHDDVRFAEVNSMAQDGTPVTVDESKLVLGTMTTVADSATYLTNLMAEMGIGEGIGYWDPQIIIYSEPSPSQPEEPSQPEAPSQSGDVSTDSGNQSTNSDEQSEDEAIPSPVTTVTSPTLPTATAAPSRTKSRTTSTAESQPQTTAAPAETEAPIQEDTEPAPESTAEEETISDEETPLAENVQEKTSSWFLLPLVIVCVLVAGVLLFLVCKHRKETDDTDDLD